MDAITILSALRDFLKLGCPWFLEPWQMKRIANAKLYIDNQKLKQEVRSMVVQSMTKTLYSQFAETRTGIEMQNIADIMSMGADIIRFTDAITMKVPSSDWCSKFIDCSKDCSSEDVRIIWAKILAGQMTSTKSFSKRTLDILSNISTQEANYFVELSSFVIADFIPKVALDYFENAHLSALVDCGLFNPIDVNLLLNAVEDDLEIPMKNLSIIAKNDGRDINLRLSGYSMTNAGRELFSIVDVESSVDFANKICKFFEQQSIVKAEVKFS
jgi:hypothetical protein